MAKLIKKARKIPLSFAQLKGRIRKTLRDYSGVLDECALTNTRRLFYLSIIAIPLRVLNILLFTTKSYDTELLKTWSNGIIASHLALLIIMAAFFLITRKLKSKADANKTMYVLQYLVVLAIMASGVAIVTIDQLVATNITPFLLTCIVSGLVFLIRPLISFIIYLVSYLAYYNLLALTTSSQEILLSNRVNGITAVGIGFFLSVILWHYNYTNIVQKRRINLQQKQLEQMAYYDSLTDLPNRRLLEKLIKQESDLMQRHGHDTVIIILDIDNFKEINDTYGHPVGDSLLRQLADFLKSEVRQSDTVFRFGGEEFIILMPKTSPEEGYAFAERLRKLILDSKFAVGPVELQITSSFGVSSMRGISGNTLEDYYLAADKALYIAKQHGKNRVEAACVAEK